MDKFDYLDQLAEIKKIIEKRTKFNALSGLSGVLAGVYALIGSVWAYRIITTSKSVIYYDIKDLLQTEGVIRLLLLASVILVLSVTTGLLFSYKNAKKSGQPLWTPAAVKVAVNFSIPMLIGALFLISVLMKGYLTLVSPICLLFYGLALLFAANYTFGEIRILGFLMLGIGCVALFFTGWGLYLWALGFGVLHIIYGLIMYLKYER